MTSRLLYISISPMVDEKPDPTVKERLKAELSGFLAFAEQCYEERCPDNYRIQTDTDNDVKALTEQYFEHFDIIFSKHWHVDEQSEVAASIIKEKLKVEGLQSKPQYDQFVDWLVNRKGARWKKRSEENGRIFYAGIAPAEGRRLSLDEVMTMES